MTGRASGSDPRGPSIPPVVSRQRESVEDSATFRAFARTSQDRLAIHPLSYGSEPSMPTPPKQPVLEDPYQIQEAFATEVAVATVGRGVLRLTFATERIESARDNEPPQAKRIVVSR